MPRRGMMDWYYNDTGYGDGYGNGGYARDYGNSLGFCSALLGSYRLGRCLAV